MILLDVSHTCHTASQTGVQQVCRNLYATLKELTSVEPIVFDPYEKCWRRLDAKERSLLELQPRRSSAQSRGSRWTWSQKLRGSMRKRFKSVAKPLSKADAILAPEILSKEISLESYDELRQAHDAPLCAVFHDAIALRLPEISPRKTVDYFPKYLKKLANFDGIAAVSESSKEDLDTYWTQLNWKNVPPISTIPLGTSLQAQADSSESSEDNAPTALFVGSIEGRKNHIELLKAAESLWRKGIDFQLELIGGCVKETGGAALELIQKLQNHDYPVKWLGPVDDDTLRESYQRCRFTIYPSFLEGFGLPVLESLSYGKPSISSNRGGLAESTQGGGCIVLEDLTAPSIAENMERLLTDETLYEQLAGEARQRVFRSWTDYGQDILAWIDETKARKSS